MEQTETPQKENAEAKGKKTFIRSILISFTAALLLTVVVAAGFTAYLYFYMTDENRQSVTQDLVIPKGASSHKIAELLTRAKIVPESPFFPYLVRLYARQNVLRAGEFRFPAQLSPYDALDIIAYGQVITRKVTIPEGVTVVQALDILAKTDGIRLNLGNIPAEGTLLPETYFFQRNESSADLVRRMQMAQKKLLDNLWQNRQQNLPYKSKQEALILASIVEKETGVSSERKHVAGVFVNRLRKGMRLQSDPTVIYGITLGQHKLDRPLWRKDLSKPTPYNTYTIPALPVGPIANPGRLAIEAVFFPKQTKDLYFVADGTGGHAFAETLSQHNANVRKWRAIERKRKK